MQDQGDAVNVVISMRYKTQLCQSDENSCIDGRWCFNAHSRVTNSKWYCISISIYSITG